MASLKRRFTVDDKRRLIEMYDRLPQMSQKDAAKLLNIGASMLCTILRNRNCIMKGERIKRKESKWVGYGRSPRLEANIWKWMDQLRLNGTRVTDLMIHQKAMAIAARMGIVSFRPSPRWYSGFKKREMVVRERYRIYPPKDQKHQRHTQCLPFSSAAVESPQEHNPHETKVESLTASEPEQDDKPSVLSSPRVLMGSMQTVTVPSVLQMQEAMKTLATGLLYRGFCNFNLLHQFENEVAKVVKWSLNQGCHDSFVA